LELGAGIVEGYWTPLAARQAAWTVAHLTPQEAERAEPVNEFETPVVRI
jgi:hypothetical protein